MIMWPLAEIAKRARMEEEAFMVETGESILTDLGIDVGVLKRVFWENASDRPK